MLKGFTHARLACGCRITFREGVEGSPVTVVVDSKSPACTMPLHVRDLPVYDYREALRPSTRLGPAEEEEFEEEGLPSPGSTCCPPGCRRHWPIASADSSGPALRSPLHERTASDKACLS